jgi:GNAT superfamily N-acetyltransferase
MGAMLEFNSRPMPELQSARDGRVAMLRAVRESDSALLEAFVKRLSPASRRRRFHGGVNGLTPAMLQHMTRPDPRRELALVLVALEDWRVACIGEARYAVGDGPAHEREFSLVVADDWQGVGLGAGLMRSLIRHAPTQGVTRLVGDVLRDNLPMVELGLRFGFIVQSHPADPRLLRLMRTIGTPAIDDALPLAAHSIEKPSPMRLVQ